VICFLDALNKGFETMSSTDIVIKSDTQEKRRHERPRVEKQVKQEHARPQSGVLVIPASVPSSKHARSTAAPTETANVMVIPSLDLKGTRLNILGNWRQYTPAKIVAIFRTHYENMRSLAVMISRMKKDLKGLDDPPPEEYLSKIALSKTEYNAIRNSIMTSENERLCLFTLLPTSMPSCYNRCSI
jgi:hypothetical protein